MAVFALVLISALVTAGFFLSSQQFRVGKANLRANAGLYSAEAGLSSAIQAWDPAAAERLAPGATVPLVSGDLPSGGTYSGWVTRLDPDTGDAVGYYLIRSVGNVRRAYGGRRALALMVRTRRPVELCCGAALQSNGPVAIESGAIVSGLDAVPVGVEAACPLPGADLPGLRLDPDADLIVAADAALLGDPAVRRLEAPADELLTFGDLDYDAIAAGAEVRLPGGSLLGRTRPALDGEGACARELPTNWGAPDDPAHPCFDHFPVVHVEGDLTIDAADRGQGVLLVDGDLEVRGGYRFAGVIIVRGRLTLEEESELTGGVSILNEVAAGTRIGGGSAVRFSSCIVARAQRLSRLNGPSPLARRGWSELLN